MDPKKIVTQQTSEIMKEFEGNLVNRIEELKEDYLQEVQILFSLVSTMERYSRKYDLNCYTDALEALIMRHNETIDSWNNYLQDKMLKEDLIDIIEESLSKLVGLERVCRRTGHGKLANQVIFHRTNMGSKTTFYTNVGIRESYAELVHETRKMLMELIDSLPSEEEPIELVQEELVEAKKYIQITPQDKFVDIERKLKEIGFTLQRVKGSHHIYSNGEQTIIIPRHQSLKTGLICAINKELLS